MNSYSISQKSTQRKGNVTNWDDLPVLLDIPLVARVLGMNVDCVRRMVASGTIPGHRIGDKLWRVDKRELMMMFGGCAE